MYTDVWRRRKKSDEEDKQKLKALEMDALGRFCRISRMDRVPNERIRELIVNKKSHKYLHKKGKLLCYGYL